MPWVTHAGDPRPWRTDPRLAGRSAPGYADDFQVFFANPDSARGGRHEVMWVRMTAYDQPSGLFLGHLLNQPHFITSVAAGDNVVVRIDSLLKIPVAVGGPAYGEIGWPSTTSPAFFATLRDGLRAYRFGNDGHNMPSIERCISVLTPAVSAIPPTASHDERFVAHFVLGRCLAEKYETARAIAQFQAAIALNPDDLDSHMALLAEYSLMVHEKPGTLTPAEDAHWERVFVDQLALVRTRFAHDPGVAQMLRLVFDPSQEAGVDSIWRPQMARLRRVGYAFFRWKQR